jgi:hypothetical protein
MLVLLKNDIITIEVVSPKKIKGKHSDGTLINDAELATIYVKYEQELRQELIRKKYENLLRGAA